MIGAIPAAMVNPILLALYTTLLLVGICFGVAHDSSLPLLNVDVFWWNVGASLFGLFDASFFVIVQMATQLNENILMSDLLRAAMLVMIVLQAFVFWMWKTATFLSLLHLLNSSHIANSLITIGNLLLFQYEFHNHGKQVFTGLALCLS